MFLPSLPEVPDGLDQLLQNVALVNQGECSNTNSLLIYVHAQNLGRSRFLPSVHLRGNGPNQFTPVLPITAISPTTSCVDFAHAYSESLSDPVLHRCSTRFVSSSIHYPLLDDRTCPVASDEKCLAAATKLTSGSPPWDLISA